MLTKFMTNLTYHNIRPYHFYILSIFLFTTRLGVNRVKPWNLVRIDLGPDIRPGLNKRHLMIEGQRGV